VTQQTWADNRLLHLNVGFLLHEGAGYTREFTFDEPGKLRVEDVSLHHLEGSLRLTRTPQGILVKGVLHAQRSVECVRCLTLVDAPIEFPFEELFVPETSPQAEEPDNKDYIIDEGGFINLTPIIREEGIVAVPMQVLCQPDCKGLCPECGQNLNEGTCDCVQESIDPRLASLRSLLDERQDE
jgi:uncharacterized protein